MSTDPLASASRDLLSLVGRAAEDRWNLGAPLGTGAVVTYSFPATKAPWDTDSGNTFQPLGPGYHPHVRAALDIWAAAGGLTFVEVPDGQGDIRFSMFDMTGLGDAQGGQLAGYAYTPTRTTLTVNGTTFVTNGHMDIGGDVFLDTGGFAASPDLARPGTDGFRILLHEIGHALGLKHPFEPEPTITPGRDSTDFTIMSYTVIGSPQTIGPLDAEAIALLYGTDPVAAAWDDALGALLREGGAASEILLGTGHDDLIAGADGNDSLVGKDGNDTLVGGAGNDTLSPGEGDDVIAGGPGVDRIVLTDFYWRGDLTVEDGVIVHRGAQGISRIDGVEAFEFLDGVMAAADLFGPGQAVTGTPGPDTLSGGDGPDTVAGLDGNDVIDGRGGNDTLDAGPGEDTVNAGQGNDTVDGGDGDDGIDGGSGDDVLRGDAGDDRLSGGDGADTLNGGDGNDVIAGGATAADLRDVIFGGAGHDRIDAGHGNDQVFGGEGDDTVEGGFGVDEIIGQGGDDVLTGSAFSDLIFGGEGNDFVNGGFGSDRVNGGAGADRFYHLGIADHGSDWIQDYSAAEGDRLVWGGGAATRSQFQVNLTETAGAGAAGVDEAFVIYRPTGQIVWALVDGGAQGAITLQIGGQVFDLLA